MDLSKSVVASVSVFVLCSFERVGLSLAWESGVLSDIGKCSAGIYNGRFFSHHLIAVFLQVLLLLL